jgi:pyruvate,water dikinase
MLRQAITGAHRSGRHVGICGQGPSDFPDLAERLVEFGIDSMSLNPDNSRSDQKDRGRHGITRGFRQPRGARGR